MKTKTVNVIENNLTVRQIEVDYDLPYIPFIDNIHEGYYSRVPLTAAQARNHFMQEVQQVQRAPLIPIVFKKGVFIPPDFVATPTPDPEVVVVWLAGSNKVGWIFDCFNQSFESYKNTAALHHKENIRCKAEAMAHTLKIEQLRRNLSIQNLTWAGLLGVIVVAHLVAWIL